MKERKIKRTVPFILAGLLLNGGSAPAADRDVSDAVSVFNAALQPPQIAYTGQITLLQHSGKKTHQENILVYYSPAYGYRREFIGRDGKPERIQVSGHDEEQIYLVRQDKLLKGRSSAADLRRMGKDAESRLLQDNYQIVLQNPVARLGRPCRVIALIPKITGKPHQRLWIDQKTSLILEAERTLPEHALSWRMQFARFDPVSPVSADLFNLKVGSATLEAAHNLEPDFNDEAHFQQASLRNKAPAAELPGHFMFESADSFDLQGSPVVCARYTDGLTVLSIYETAKPVRVPPRIGRMGFFSKALTGGIGAANTVHVFQTRHQGHYYTFVSDISPELLRQIAAHWVR